MNLSLKRRRQLRRDQTPAEKVLWYILRDRRFEGFKFRRQHPCGPYILDFCCIERSLVIELDGGQHFEPRAEAYDQCRSAFLREKGWSILRFTNPELLFEREGVLQTIVVALGSPSPPRVPRLAVLGPGG